MSANAPAADPIGVAGRLEYTGERYLPSEKGLIRLEHLHRYAAACDFVAEKAVLDIACGEGYGCGLLSGKADQVIGVDIDPSTVDNAARAYAALPHVQFLVGSCDAIPLPDNSVDIVTSFETIEHHDRHEEMMREVKRVLRPGGLLILSSPNRLVYSDQADYHNPFHVKELYRDELMDLLRRHFTSVRLFGQMATLGSFIAPADHEGAADMMPSRARPVFVEDGAGELSSAIVDSLTPYFIAFCSDVPDAIATASSSAFFSPPDDTLRRQAEALRWCEEEIARHKTYLPQLEAAYRDKEAEVRELERVRARADQQAEELASTQEALRATQERLRQIEEHPAFRLAVRVRRIGRGGRG